MTRILLFVLATLLSLQAFAEDLRSKDDVNQLVSSVVELMGAGQTVEGLALLNPYTVMTAEELDASLDQLKQRLPALEKRFGKIVGAEYIETKEVGESLLLAVFLQKFEKHALRWQLYFYKPGDKWILNTYRMDDSIRDMFAN